jgi:uncharacterized protein
VSGATISSIIAKVVGRCNLNCTYCYVYNHEDRSYLRRPTWMSDAVFDGMLERMRRYCDAVGEHTMSLVLHGGEPTLMGVARFEALVARARGTLGSRLRLVSMQTNAVLLDEHWIDAIRRLGVNVAISLDGPRHVHDAARVDHRGRGSYDATVAGIRRLADAGIDPLVLCVVQPGADGVAVYEHFLSLGVRWMNFLLPDVSHDSRAVHYPSAGPTPVADFLLPIFERWFRDDDPRIVITMFWDLIRAVMGGAPASDCFGNPALRYLIVETDGAVEALDALRVCADGLTATGLNVLTNDIDELEAASPWIHMAVTRGLPLCAECEACRHRRVCGGGFLPHRHSRARGFDNPSVWCRDIQILLDRIVQVVGADQRA